MGGSADLRGETVSRFVLPKHVGTMSRAKRNLLPQTPAVASIDSLSKDCRGVAHIGGKAVFISGALPKEEVKFLYTARGRRYDEGRTVEVIKAAAHRTDPRCPHHALCGGCSLQHLESGAQLQAKQQVLEENLKRIGHLEPRRWLEPLAGPVWGYRRKARLGVRWVEKKAKVLVGFREKHGRKLADIHACEVLDPRVGQTIAPLSAMLERLEAREQIPQIEVACGDETCTLVFRHMVPLSEGDRARLIEFGRQHGLQIALQSKGPDSITPLWPEIQPLGYRLPHFDLRFDHRPLDFTQINVEINRQMTASALDLLQPEPHHRILDLYCGIGNFSLCLARRAGEVTGVESEADMVARAKSIAAANGIANVQFHAANLAEPFADAPWFRSRFDAALLDPPRSGALVAIEALAAKRIRRIVYVSCHPASLARDAECLISQHGYSLETAGVMDMFPHTAHVESIALFTLGDAR